MRRLFTKTVPSVEKGTYGSCCVPRRGAGRPVPRRGKAPPACRVPRRVPRRGEGVLRLLDVGTAMPSQPRLARNAFLSAGTLRPPACRICRSSRPSREKIANPILSKVVALKRRHASSLKSQIFQRENLGKRTQKSQKSGGRRRACLRQLRVLFTKQLRISLPLAMSFYFFLFRKLQLEVGRPHE